MAYLHEKLTEEIISRIIKVHQTLGPGFLESIYKRALILELDQASLHLETEKEIIVFYSGQEIGRHRLDLLVETQIVLEIKAVQELNSSHYAQVRSYLKATGLRVGLLVNFSKLQADYRRIEL